MGETNVIYDVDEYDLTWLIRGSRVPLSIANAEVDDPSIFSAQVSHGRVVVKALKPGQTKLSVHFIKSHSDPNTTDYYFTKTLKLQAFK